ncbi:MAG: ferrous iron transport protein A [Actinomycetes bacterium]
MTSAADSLTALPLGTRVVVRYRLHGDTHRATDALGDLVALDAVTCTVATRRGDVEIALADVLLAKPVPPPPAPRPR